MNILFNKKKLNYLVLLTMWLGQLCAQQQFIEKQLKSYYEILTPEKIYVQTDRTYYQPGQTIWFSIYLLTQKLNFSNRSKFIRVELLNPEGSIQQDILLEYNDKIGNVAGDFLLDKNAKGGCYKLRVYSNWMEQTKQIYFEKALTVQTIVYSNILMELDFEREAYGPGSFVQANLKLKNLQNEALVNKKLNYTISLGGKSLITNPVLTNIEGKALVQFKLPKTLQTTDGLLTVKIKYNEIVESISRSIPITLNKLDLQFLPEGGNYVLGNVQKVAFLAQDEFGQPADISGIVLLGEDTLSFFRSYHQGMGSFEIKPKTLKDKYTIKIIEPVNNSQSFSLNLAENQGTTALCVKNKTKDSLTIEVYTLVAQKLSLVLKMQGKLQYQHTFRVVKGSNLLTIPIAKMPIGIAQLTVFDKNLIPQAERLVFLNKHRQLQVTIKTDKKHYAPNEKVIVNLKVQDKALNPVAGHFALAVVDEKNVTLADDKQGNILATLLLTEDLKGEISEPNFYFDPEEPKADTALDYVLLTHGWRRFEWKSLLKERKEDWQKQVHELADKCFIKGQATINSMPLRNRLILLKKENYFTHSYNKKTAAAWAMTDKQGYFEFKEDGLTFPMYLSTNYRGVWTTADIPTAKTGIYKARVIESFERTPYNEGSYDSYYANKYRKNEFKDDKTAFRNVAETVEISDYWSSIDTHSRHRITSRGNIVTGTIEVHVKSIFHDEDLPFANVALFHEGQLVDGIVTDFNGNGVLNYNMELGEYTLIVSYVGYKTYENYIFLDGQYISIDVELGENVLLFNTPTNNEPGVITVKAHRSYRDYGANGGASAPMSRNLGHNTMSMNRVEKKKKRAFNNAEQAIIRRLYKPAAQKQEQFLARYGYGPLNRYTFLDENNDWKASAEVRFDLQQIKARTYYKARKFISYKRYTGVTKRNFNETAYWEPQLKTDQKGKAEVSFYNTDALSSFKVRVEGAGQGNIGRGECVFYTQSSVEIIAKVPPLVSVGDTVLIPIVLRNNTDRVLEGALKVSLKQRYQLLKKGEVSMEPNTSQTTYIQLIPKEQMESSNQLVCMFDAKGNKQRVEHPIRIISKGFPKTYTITSKQISVKDTIIIGKAVRGTLNAKFYAELDPLNSLAAAIDGILKYPSGCFEQVSAKNYPNILAMQYMNTMKISDVARRKKIRNYLKLGYEKLVGYETKVGGFEWYGDTPPHLGLTAYGLLQFYEMQSIYDGVDPKMMRRVKQWILNTRDGKGGFVQEGGKYSFSNKNEAITNAYVLYVLSHSKTKGLEKELAVATEEAQKSKDLYRLGLMIQTYLNYGNQKLAKKLWKAFEEQLNPQKLYKTTAQSSITNSRGRALNIEVVSMGILIMMRLKAYKNRLLEASIKHIYARRSGHVFGNTQSTIWALKAIIEYQKKYPPKVMEGIYALKVNGAVVKTISYSNKDAKRIGFADLAAHFFAGENIVEMTCTPKLGKIPPYSLDLNWVELLPARDTACLVQVETNIAKQHAQIGETVRLTASLKNKSNEAQASTVALIGIPAGLSLQAWQLKALQDQNKVDYIELMEDYVVLHYRNLEPKEEHRIHFDLKTEFMGYYQAPTSVAYLYYHNEHKHWSTGADVQIKKNKD